MSAGNVRLALDLVRQFFGSGHINTQKILDIYHRSGGYRIPLHEFLRAIIYDDTYQRAAEHQLAALRPYRFGADPRQEQTRNITVG